jgi:predicted metalloendopeptidase
MTETQLDKLQEARKGTWQVNDWGEPMSCLLTTTGDCAILPDESYYRDSYGVFCSDHFDEHAANMMAQEFEEFDCWSYSLDRFAILNPQLGAEIPDS